VITWTKVSDALPASGGSCLVTVERRPGFPEVQQGFYDPVGVWLETAEGFEHRLLPYVTHWAPWPEPAK
jgi:hypothetical protein